jgi:hypothetical protein
LLSFHEEVGYGSQEGGLRTQAHGSGGVQNGVQGFDANLQSHEEFSEGGKVFVDGSSPSLVKISMREPSGGLENAAL